MLDVYVPTVQPQALISPCRAAWKFALTTTPCANHPATTSSGAQQASRPAEPPRLALFQVRTGSVAASHLPWLNRLACECYSNIKHASFTFQAYRNRTPIEHELVRRRYHYYSCRVNDAMIFSLSLLDCIIEINAVSYSVSSLIGNTWLLALYCNSAHCYSALRPLYVSSLRTDTHVSSLHGSHYASTARVGEIQIKQTNTKKNKNKKISCRKKTSYSTQ